MTKWKWSDNMLKDEKGNNVLLRTGCMDQQEANLISAAPELLVAAQLALEFVEATHGHRNGLIAELLVNAINKAEGRNK